MVDGFGIVGKWMAGFTMNGTSLTDITGFESFKIVEEAGNQLPTFTLVFRSADAGLLSYLNEGNTISAGMGVTQIDLNTTLRPMSKAISRADSSTLRFTVNGMYDAINYLTSTQTQMSDQVSGLTFMQQLASQHFTPDFSTSASNDTMNWSQPGIPNQAMIEHLWAHSDLGNNNFPMIGITSDGTFRLRTATDLANGSATWNYTNGQQLGGNVVNFHYDWDIQSDTGYTNAVAAYSKTSDIQDMDKGPGSLFNTSPGQLFGQSASLEQSSGAGQQIIGNLLSNVNHHSNFHQARADNVTNIANASSTKLNINNSDYYFPIKVLDTILFTEFLDDGTSLQSFSGMYIVTQVTRAIENGQFHTMITAVRESLNNVQISS